MGFKKFYTRLVIACYITIFITIMSLVIGFIWLDKHYVWGRKEVSWFKGNTKIVEKKEMKYSFFERENFTEIIMIGYKDNNGKLLLLNTFTDKQTDKLMRDYKNRIYVEYFNGDGDVIGIFRKK